MPAARADRDPTASIVSLPTILGSSLHEGTQMRNFIRIAAVAATILSSASFVLAATLDHDHDHDRGRARAAEVGLARGPTIHHDGDDGDVTPVGPAYMPAVTPMPVLSRVGTIVGELRADQARLNAERRDNQLAPAQFRRLTAEEMRIRGEALRVARRDGGKIPDREFASLRHQVRQLDRQISKIG